MTTESSGKWRGRLAGCAIGCGLFLLIVILVLFSFYRWATTPGPQIATEAIIGAESAGFVRLQGQATDEGVLQLLHTSLSHLDESRREQLERSEAPVIVKWLARMGGGTSDNVDDLTEDLPREITATVELLPDHEPQVVVAANLARFPRFIKLASSVMGLVRGVEVHGDRVYQDYGEGGTVAFVENTIIWTGEGDVIRVVLDRVDQAAADDRASHDMYEAYEDLSVRWDLFGNLKTPEELITWILRGAEQLARDDAPDFLKQVPLWEPQLRTIKKIRFGFDIVSDQVLEGELVLQLDNPDSARTWREMLVTATESSSLFQISVVQHDRSVIFEIHTDRLAETLSEVFPN